MTITTVYTINTTNGKTKRIFGRTENGTIAKAESYCRKNPQYKLDWIYIRGLKESLSYCFN